MSFLLSLFNILLYLLAAYLLGNCLYLLFFAVAGHWPARLRAAPAGAASPRRLAVFMPCYREDAVILETAPQAQAHHYRGEARVVVIADGLRPDTVHQLRQQDITVVEVQFERSTKGKALRFALDALPADAFDGAVVLDADNVLTPGVLDAMDDAFGRGYRAVQAHRTAKNQGTAFALLDACNEEINNHLYRQGPAAVGLPAALIGSGMAFDYAYLQRLLADIGETVGEDKELDFRLARDGQSVAYLSHAYVLDEKIENAQVFTQQRTRWLASQWEFMKKYGPQGLPQLLRGNGAFFNKVVQAFLVPRTLLLGLLGLLVLASGVVWLLAPRPVGPSPLLWVVLLAMLVAALLLSLPGRYYNRATLRAVAQLPYAIWCMVRALLGMGRTRTSFLATPHKVQSALQTD